MRAKSVMKPFLLTILVLAVPCCLACGSSGESGTDAGVDAAMVDTVTDKGTGGVDHGLPPGCMEGTGKVGAEGGCIALAQGSGAGTRIEIPAGALTTETEITLAAAQTIAGEAKSLGNAVDFKPDGQMFAVPVEIYLPRGSASELSVYVSAQSSTLKGLIGNAWLAVQSDGVLFKTSHFSTYEPVNPKIPIPPQFVGKWTKVSCVDTQDSVETYVQSWTSDEDGNEDIELKTPGDEAFVGTGSMRIEDAGGGLFSYRVATSVPVYVEWIDADTTVFALGELFSDRIVGDTDPESDENNIEEDRYCTYTRVSGTSAIGALEGRWEMTACDDPGIEYLRNSYWELGPGSAMKTDPEQKSDEVGFYYPNAAGTKFIADHLDIVSGFLRLTGDTITMSYHMPYMDLDEVVTDETGDHSCTYTVTP